MSAPRDLENLEQVCSLDIHRVQSSRLRNEGLPEEDELRVGIESKIEVDEAARKQRVISFSPGDPENPHNWSSGKKWFITASGILAVTNSTFASSLPSGALPFIQKDLDVERVEVAVLTISVFLLGYFFGPILFAPYSEWAGRRTVTLVAFGWFVIGSICCAVAPNIEALLVFRFLTGMGASAPMSVTGGVLADIWHEPEQRGRTMAVFSAVTMIGPTLSPVIGGFVSNSRLGWRMVFWIEVIVSALSFIPLTFCPETFAPILLLRKARRLRSQGATGLIAPLELEDRSFKSSLKTTLSRPFRMFFFEAVVLLVSIFLSFVYGVFYLFFQSYPLIYEGIYHFGPGISGLPFIPVGVGGGLAYFAVLIWDAHLRKLTARGETFSAEYRRLPLACIAGPIYVISMFWQAWTVRADIHYLVPIAAGVPFGFAFALLFIALLNYITDFYEIYAASALAAASMCRSLFGAAFPLFAKHMYKGMGINWASSFLGMVAALLTICPFLFIKYGDAVRRRSRFHRFLQERKEMFELREKEEGEEASTATSRTEHEGAEEIKDDIEKEGK